MAKRSAIPQDMREWPDYEYRPFPKWVGRDEFGQDLIANSEEEATELEVRKVYPKLLGLDARGSRVEALHPDEVAIKKTQVTRPAEQVIEKAEPNKLGAEQPAAEAPAAEADDPDAKPVKKAGKK